MIDTIKAKLTKLEELVSEGKRTYPAKCELCDTSRKHGLREGNPFCTFCNGKGFYELAIESQY